MRKTFGKCSSRSILGLVRGPVVAVARQPIPQERIHPAREPREERRPGQARKPIGDPLCPPGILEPEEGIVETTVAEAPLVELAGEPVVAVDVDLDGEGEPGLQADVEQAALGSRK